MTNRDADYLAALPPHIQGELVCLVRQLAGMDASEKQAAGGLYGTAALFTETNGDAVEQPAAHVLVTLFRLVRAVVPEIKEVA